MNASDPTFLIGTVVKITSEIEVEGGAPDSVKILSIKNEKGKDVLGEEEEMTQVGETNVYQYIWQTADSFESGEYTALIEAAKGDYTAKSELTFNLKAQA